MCCYIRNGVYKVCNDCPNFPKECALEYGKIDEEKLIKGE